jgi:hypothetical protein
MLDNITSTSGSIAQKPSFAAVSVDMIGNE